MEALRSGALPAGPKPDNSHTVSRSPPMTLHIPLSLIPPFPTQSIWVEAIGILEMK